LAAIRAAQLNAGSQLALFLFARIWSARRWFF